MPTIPDYPVATLPLGPDLPLAGWQDAKQVQVPLSLLKAFLQAENAELSEELQAAFDAAVAGTLSAAEGYAIEAQSAAAAILPSADNNRLGLLKPYMNTQSIAGTVVLDTSNHFVASADNSGVVWRIPLTAAEIAAGKVWVDIAGTITAPTVGQRTNSAAIGGAAAIPVVGDRFQKLVTLDPTATFVEVYTGVMATGIYSTGPSVTIKLPADVPASGDYYGAFGRAALGGDGVQLLNPVPRSIGTFGSGTTGTFDVATGIVTIPVSSRNRVVFGFQKLLAVPTFGAYRAMIEIISGTPEVTQMQVFALDGVSGNFTGAFGVNKRLGEQNAYVSDVLDFSGAADHAPSLVTFDVQNRSGSSPLVIRCTLYLGSVPMLANVPAVVAKAISDASATAPVQTVQAGGAGRVDVRGSTTRVQVRPSDFLIEQATDARIEAYAKIDAGKAVSALSGNNANAGTRAAPLQTLQAAMTALGAGGGNIGLKNGEEHGFDDTAAATHFKFNLFGYGPILAGQSKALVDFRQHLPQGAGFWTNAGGGRWTCTVTHRQPSNLQLFHPVMWVGRQALAFQVGGASQAANQAAALALGDAFEVHQTGSTNQDPTKNSAGTIASATSFVYSVYLKSGLDPNTLDMSVSDIDYTSWGDLSNVEIIGLCGKDFLHSDLFTEEAPLPTYHNVTLTGCGDHGSVGPKNTTGLYEAIHVGPGVGTGGLHLFLGAHPSFPTLHEEVHCEGMGEMVYCHGAVNPNTGHDSDTFYSSYYASLYVKNLWGGRAQGNGTAIGVGKIAKTIVVDEANLYNHGIMIGYTNAPGGVFFNGGYVEFAESGHFIEAMVSPVYFSDYVFRSIQTSGPGGDHLYFSAAGATSTLTLTRCEDRSLPAYCCKLYSNNGLNKTALVIVDSLFWDIEQGSGALPASLTVKGKSRIGFGGRTRQAIRDYLAANSVACTIDDSVTIVDQSGAIIDPGTS